jgi:NADH-quinone oxidoreductase subunit K
MSVELMLLAINMNFVIFSVHLDDLLGQIFALFILTIAASESAIGLAILVVYHKVRETIAIEKIQTLRY